MLKSVITTLTVNNSTAVKKFFSIPEGKEFELSVMKVFAEPVKEEKLSGQFPLSPSYTLTVKGDSGYIVVEGGEKTPAYRKVYSVNPLIFTGNISAVLTSDEEVTLTIEITGLERWKR